jgi:transposase, IS5 family
MKPRKLTNDQEDLFKNRLSNQLNPSHELVQLSKLIPWDKLDVELSGSFAEKTVGGRPAIPVRLMVG